MLTGLDSSNGSVRESSKLPAGYIPLIVVVCVLVVLALVRKFCGPPAVYSGSQRGVRARPLGLSGLAGTQPALPLSTQPQPQIGRKFTMFPPERRRVHRVRFVVDEEAPLPHPRRPPPAYIP